MKEKPAQNPGLAALLIVLASAFIAASTLFAKLLGTDALNADPLHPLQISHGRFLFALVALGSVALIRRLKFQNVHWKLHVGRSFCGWGGVTLMFAAVAYIPMADATALSFTSPVFTLLFAVLLLHEKVGPIRWIATAIALAGAIILLRPDPGSFEPAALLALCAAIMMGFEIILIKALAGRERLFQVLVINNLIGLTIATLAVIPVWHLPEPRQWAALAGVGVTMAIAQTCFINGTARADASFVAPFNYTVLVFAALFDLAVFGAIPDLVSVAGAAVILTGALVLAWREAKRKPKGLHQSVAAK